MWYSILTHLAWSAFYMNWFMITLIHGFNSSHPLSLLAQNRTFLTLSSMPLIQLICNTYFFKISDSPFAI